MSSADSTEPRSSSGAGDELNPVDGGRWRPVRPEELLRKNAIGPIDWDTNDSDAGSPRLQLERRQELEHHLRSRPTDREGYLELAHIYRAENRPADAKRVLQQAIDVFPDDDGIKWEYEEAVLARSLQQLREVHELAQRLDTVETRRELQRSQNDWACRRIEVCRARLERDPSRVYLHLNLAEALMDAGDFEEAIAETDHILDHDEFSCTAYLVRGRCLLHLGRDLDAMEALRAAALRRSVVGPPQIRVAALRLLCEAAERLELPATLQRYRKQLNLAEQALAQVQSGDRQSESSLS